MPELITITGIDGICAAFDALPKDIVKGAFAKALTAACLPVIRELEARTPEETGALKAHLMTDIALDSEGRGGQAQIGYGRLGYVALFVEYGHRAVGHKPAKTDKGKLVRAHPFMRPAIETAAQESVEAFAESLKESAGL